MKPVMVLELNDGWDIVYIEECKQDAEATVKALREKNPNKKYKLQNLPKYAKLALNPYKGE